LALNLGAIGALAYQRHLASRAQTAQEAAAPMPMRELWGALKLDDQQRLTLRSLMPGHRRQVMQLRRELGEKRLELAGLMRDPAAPWDAVQAKVREVGALQMGLEEEIARFLRELQKNLRPDQQAAFGEMVHGRMCRSMGERGRGFGPMGPGRGRGWGPGAGPHCPE
jgi:Spy/CpxP family protein refolding chaperone